MKKYFYSILALLAVICGFTAWGAAGGVSLLADGDTELTPVLDKCVPAENGSVKGLSYILFTFDENETDIQLNPAFTNKTLGQISVPTGTGTYKSVVKVTSDDKDLFDHQIDGKPVAANQIVYHLAEPITVEEAATYHIAFGGIFISASGAVNPNIKYDFTIEPESAEPEPLTINTSACIPAEGGKVDYLPYVVLTFGENDTDIKLNPDYTGTTMAQITQALSGTVMQAFKVADAATILTHEIDGRQLDDNQIALKLPTALTNNFVQNSKLTVYKGAFISGATGQTMENDVQFEFKLVPTIGALAPITSSIPADGSTVDAPVTEIIFITPFELCDENTYFVDGSKGEIVNVETNEVVESLNSGSFNYKVNGSALPDNQFAYFPTTPLGAGTYRLTLAARVLKDCNGDKDENEEYTFTFSVVGEVVPDPLTVNTAACIPAAGSSVSEIPYVILTFGEKDTDIKLNPDFTGENIGRIARSTGNPIYHYFRTEDASTILTHEVDGNKLADNQIALIITPTLINTDNYDKPSYVIINKDAFISGATGGVQELPIQYNFTLTPPPAELLPMDATVPANESKVEAPVTEIVFTCNSKMAIVDINPQFSGAYGSVVDLNTNEIVDEFKHGTWQYESNGQALAENQLAYVFPTPLEVGKYKVSIAEGTFKDGESPYYENEAFEFTFTVVKDLNAPVETFDYGFSYSSYGMYNIDNYSFKRKKFNTNIAFTDLPTGASLDATKCPAKWVRESDGTVVTAEVKDFLGTMMMFTDGADWTSDPFGVWTCVLPQGLFVAGDTESVEKTLMVTWLDPEAEAQRPEFEVTKFNFLNTPDVFSSEEGQPADVPGAMMYTLWKTVDGGEDMLDWETSPKSIEALNLNRGFVINTNWDEWITCFIAEVKRKDGTGEIDSWNQETVQEIYGKGNYCKNYVGSSESDCTPYQHPMLGCGGNADTREYAKDVVYTFDIWFYDTLQKRGMDNSKHDLACGSYHFEFTGATAPFEYSDIARLVSITPGPANAAELDLDDQTAGEVRGLEAPITFTWSAPVTMTATYSLGSSGGLADVQSCTPNDDNTVWTVIPGEAVISNGEGGYLDVFEFNVQAIDDNGHYVKGNVGEKRNTMFVPRFNFVDVSTGLDAIIAGNLSVVSTNGSIIVSGVTEGMTVSVFTLEGLELSKVKAAGPEVEFANVLPGAYLIIVTDGDARTAVKMLHK